MSHLDEDMDAWGLTTVERIHYLNRVWRYSHDRATKAMDRLDRRLANPWPIRVALGLCVVGVLLSLTSLVARLMG